MLNATPRETRMMEEEDDSEESEGTLRSMLISQSDGTLLRKYDHCSCNKIPKTKQW